jgi:hypothetical protein
MMPQDSPQCVTIHKKWALWTLTTTTIGILIFSYGGKIYVTDPLKEETKNNGRMITENNNKATERDNKQDVDNATTKVIVEENKASLKRIEDQQKEEAKQRKEDQKIMQDKLDRFFEKNNK